jgi:hypothetical protein
MITTRLVSVSLYILYRPSKLFVNTDVSELVFD